MALLSGDMPRAEELLRTALAAYEELGEINSNVLMGRVELAMTLAFQGRPEAAVALCEEVRAVCADHGERWARAYALYVLAYAAWTDGDHGRARELLTGCLAIDHAFHDMVGTVLTIELLALVTASEGDAAEAAVLQGAAAPLWNAVGTPLFDSGHFGTPRALCRQRAGESLGADRYEACVREGHGLSLDEVVERALQAGPRPDARIAAGRRPTAAPRETRKPADSPIRKGGEAAGRGA